MQLCINQIYQFDSVHEEEATQSDVYLGSIEPLISTFLAGGSVALLTYGATGSGKTFTLAGDGIHRKNRGMVQRSVEAVLHSVEALQMGDVRLWATFTGAV
jgi:hypothetical protein